MARDLNWFSAGYGALQDEEAGVQPGAAQQPQALQWKRSYREKRTGTMVDRNAALKAFMAKVGDIRRELVLLKDKFKDLGDTYEDSFSAANSEQMNTFKADLEGAMREIRDSTQKLVNSVKSLRQQEVDAAETDASLLRLKRGKTAELETELAAFRDEVLAFQTRMKDNRRKEYRDKLKAYLNKEPTDEEVDRWAESGDDQALYSALLVDQSRPAVQKVLSDIQERHRAAKALQTSIEQLFNQFQEMQSLVHLQGKQIEALTARLDDADDYISTGTKALGTAVKVKATTARTQIVFYGIVAAAVLVVTAVILGTVLPLVNQ